MTHQRFPSLILIAIWSLVACRDAASPTARLSSSPTPSSTSSSPPMPANGRGLGFERAATEASTTRLSLAASVEPLPARFNWIAHGIVTEAKHQGSCNSCWAFASAAVMESKILRAGGPRLDLSEQQLVSCHLGSCAVGSGSAFQYWRENSPMTESCAPYANKATACDFTCEDIPFRAMHTISVDGDRIEEIKRSIYADGPGFFGFDLYTDFDRGMGSFWDNAAPGDVYRHTGGRLVGGHAVVVVGWDDHRDGGALLCKNSWGLEGPNADGTFWIAYSGHATNLGFSYDNVDIQGECNKPDPRECFSRSLQRVTDTLYASRHRQLATRLASGAWTTLRNDTPFTQASVYPPGQIDATQTVFQKVTISATDPTTGYPTAHYVEHFVWYDLLGYRPPLEKIEVIKHLETRDLYVDLLSLQRNPSATTCRVTGAPLQQPGVERLLDCVGCSAKMLSIKAYRKAGAYAGVPEEGIDMIVTGSSGSFFVFFNVHPYLLQPAQNGEPERLYIVLGQSEIPNRFPPCFTDTGVPIDFTTTMFEAPLPPGFGQK